MKKLRTWALALLATGMCACMDLNEQLYSELDKNNFYKTEQEVMAAFMRPYAHIRGISVYNTWYLQELTTDEACFPQKGRDGYDGGNWQRLHWHSWTSQESSIAGAWNDLYMGIGFCNAFLSDLPGIQVVSEAQKTVLTAETRAMRALFYSYLLDMFGNVPIVEDVTTPSPATRPRAEVFAWVVKELKEVQPQLMPSSSSRAYGRLSQEGAQALLARLYLNAQVYAGQPMWAEAAQQAKAVVTSGRFAMERSWHAPFASDNHKSKENIFVLPCDAINANASATFFVRNTHWAQRPQFDWKGNGGWNGVATVEAFIARYDTLNDQRCKYDPLNGQYGQFMWGPQFDMNGDPILGTNEFNGKQLSFDISLKNMVENKENAGARNVKYRPEAGAPGLDADIVTIRLPEMYFIWAEASLRQQGQVDAEALEGINQVRRRAGVPVYTQAQLTAQELYDEKGREFAYEMHRRTDMIRFGKFTAPMWDKPQSEAYRTLFPIPYTQISLNPNLKQNPGY